MSADPAVNFEPVDDVEPVGGIGPVGSRRTHTVRLRALTIVSWLVGACLLVAAVTILVVATTGQLGSASSATDRAQMQVLWSLQNLELPLFTVGLVALVLPFFVAALRSRLGR